MLEVTVRDIVIGRIGEYQIEVFGLMPRRPGAGESANGFDAAVEIECFYILYDDSVGSFVHLNRYGVTGTPTDGLDSQGSAAGEGVKHAEALDIAQDAEQGAAHFVTHGMGAVAARTGYGAPAEVTSNNSHGVIVYRFGDRLYYSAASLAAPYHTSATACIRTGASWLRTRRASGIVQPD